MIEVPLARAQLPRNLPGRRYVAKTLAARALCKTGADISGADLSVMIGTAAAVDVALRSDRTVEADLSSQEKFTVNSFP